MKKYEVSYYCGHCDRILTSHIVTKETVVKGDEYSVVLVGNNRIDFDNYVFEIKLLVEWEWE